VKKKTEKKNKKKKIKVIVPIANQNIKAPQKNPSQKNKKNIKNKIHLQKSQSKLIASLYLQKITKKNHPNPKMKMI